MAVDADLIAAIYDAIIDPSGWDYVVKRIVEETKSVSGGLHITHMDALKPTYAAHISAAHNTDPVYDNTYVAAWHNHNPLFPSAATTLPGEVRACTHITQTDKFRALAFFNEFMRPQE